MSCRLLFFFFETEDIVGDIKLFPRYIESLSGAPGLPPDLSRNHHTANLAFIHPVCRNSCAHKEGNQNLDAPRNSVLVRTRGENKSPRTCSAANSPPVSAASFSSAFGGRSPKHFGKTHLFFFYAFISRLRWQHKRPIHDC